MLRMYFRRKKEYDYGQVIGRLYRYGKVQVAIFITKEEDRQGLLKYMRDIIKREIDPCKKATCMFQSPCACKIHNYLLSHPLK